MAEIKKRWYVVRAISGKEKKVKEYLDFEISRLKLDDYVGQVLIPTEKVFQIRKGKKDKDRLDENTQKILNGGGGETWVQGTPMRHTSISG